MLHFSNMQITADMIQTLISLNVILHAMEIIVERKQYGAKGIYRYELLEKPFPWMVKGSLVPLLQLIFDLPCYLFLITLELISAILLVSHLFIHFSGWFLFIIFLVHLLSCVRHLERSDGADQMQTILFASLLIFYATSDQIVKLCCLLFIAFQALLSYLTSGITKMHSSIWRNGTALEYILQSPRFRNETLAYFLMRKPSLSKLLCWSVLLFEGIFPILVFTGVQTCLLFLGTGILFHLSIALIMGLNSFFWSYVATYPAILFSATLFQLTFFSHGSSLPF